MSEVRTICVFIASPERRSQEVINREIDHCDACRLGLRPDRVSVRTVGYGGGDADPQLQKVLDFRKSLEESRQVLSHGFANEAEFKAELDRHLRTTVHAPQVSHPATPTKTTRQRASGPKAVKSLSMLAMASSSSRSWFETECLQGIHRF